MAWFVGAGGPMGRMHVQRAIQVPGSPAVMVCTESMGLKVRFGFVPAARTTAIVSPTARLMARITAAAMPEIAAGSRTFRTVSQRVAPIA